MTCDDMETLLKTGLYKISEKCKKIPFWSDVFTALSDANKGFYRRMIHVTGELPLYGNSCFIENGQPLNKANFARTTTSKFVMCRDLLNSVCNSLDPDTLPQNGVNPTSLQL